MGTLENLRKVELNYIYNCYWKGCWWNLEIHAAWFSDVMRCDIVLSFSLFTVFSDWGRPLNYYCYTYDIIISDWSSRLYNGTIIMVSLYRYLLWNEEKGTKKKWFCTLYLTTLYPNFLPFSSNGIISVCCSPTTNLNQPVFPFLSIYKERKKKRENWLEFSLVLF